MIKYLITILLASLVITAYTQPNNEKVNLQKERETIKKELSDLQLQLTQIQGNKRVSLSQIRIIQDQMATRQKLVNNIEQEVNYIERDMTKTQREINNLNTKLDTLKIAYAKSIVYAYKNRNNYDFLTFIFSSNNFNEAYKRIEYLKSYRNFRERQAEDIKKYKETLQGKTKILDDKKTEKSNVLQNKSNELNELAGDKNKLDNNIKVITSKEYDLGSRIAKNKKRQQFIGSQLTAMLKREALIRKKQLEAELKERKRIKDLADAQTKAEEKAKAIALAKAKAEAIKNNTKVPATTTTEVAKVTPKPVAIIPKPVPKLPTIDDMTTIAEANANASFEQNRGRLPYPLQGSVISIRFGLQSIGGVKYNSESTTFETNSPGSSVLSIFNGSVSGVYEDDGRYTVYIAHGRYKSVYDNLASVTVKKDQIVSINQVIGKCAGSEDGNNRGSLDLMLYKDAKLQNPEAWIRR